MASQPKPTKSAMKDAVHDVAYASFILFRVIIIPFQFIFQAFNTYFFACFKLYITRAGNCCFRCLDGKLL